MGQDKKPRSRLFNKIDPITDEPYPSKVDFEHLFRQIKAEREKMEATQKKKKMSYSVSPSSQVLIKNLAESYGATQGGIVDLAPFFFSTVLQKSLKRREEKIPLLNEISRQATSSLNGMALNAPHLQPYIDLIVNMVETITAMEKKAVTDQNFHGVNAEKKPEFASVNKKSTPPAFVKEILEFMGQDNELEDLLKTLFDEGS